MKTYIKPSVEEIAVGVSAPIVTSPGPGVDSEVGSDTAGMNAPGRKRVYIEDDYDDEDFGW